MKRKQTSCYCSLLQSEVLIHNAAEFLLLLLGSSLPAQVPSFKMAPDALFSVVVVCLRSCTIRSVSVPTKQEVCRKMNAGCERAGGSVCVFKWRRAQMRLEKPKEVEGEFPLNKAGRVHDNAGAGRVCVCVRACLSIWPPAAPIDPTLAGRGRKRG